MNDVPAKDEIDAGHRDPRALIDRCFFDTSPVGAAVLDRNGFIVDVNAALSSLLDRSAEVLRRSHAAMLVKHDGCSGLARSLREALRTGHCDITLDLRPDEPRDRRTGPGRIAVRLVPLRAPHGAVSGWLLHAQPVTVPSESDVRAEALLAQLTEEQRWLATVLDRCPVAVALFEGPRGEQVFLNQHAQSMLGLSLEPLPGSRFSLDPSMALEGRPSSIGRADGADLQSIESAAFRALQGAIVRGEECELQGPDGESLTVLLSAAAIRSTDGEIIGAVVVADDMSERKQLERLREEWTSVVAHDLRQPLSVISTYAGLLQRTLVRRSDPLAAHLGHILASVRMLDRMIADLSDLSRLEASRLQLERQPTDLDALVKSVLERNARVVEAYRLDVAVAPTASPVRIDPGRFEQVLGNLLSNAAKYGRAGTEIRVAVKSTDGDVHVCVTNEGDGIPDGEITRLFRRFHRIRRDGQRASGLGLGLYISKGLVEAHGGRMWAESTPGHTTSFHFTLPLGEGEA